MAIIATVSFSKKIPVPDSEYSSQGYSLALQTEIPETEPRAIRARLHEAFELVKASVEQELSQASARQTRPDEPAGPPARGAGGSVAKASNKQIKFLTDLAGARGMSLADLNANVQKRFGVPGLYDLDRKQASTLLDEMNNGGGRRAA